MTRANEAEWDRAVRMLGGVLLLAAGCGWYSNSGAPMVVLIVLGAVLLVSGLMGYCPLYRLFHVSTRKVV